MSHPTNPIDDDLNPGEYGFAGPAPERRQAPPIKHDKFATSEPEDEDTRPRRRKRRRNDGDPREEPAAPPKKARRDLATEPPPEPPQKSPWYVWTAVLTVVGLVGVAAAAGYVGVKGGAAVGALALAGGTVAVLLETAAAAAVLFFVGTAFGIDYGPVGQGVVKLIGCVAFVNGFTLGFGLICYGCVGPLGILMAMSTVTLVSFAVFQSQFQLSMYETLVTVFVIQGAAWLMATGLALSVMSTIR